MVQLSQLTDYRHSNIYVQREKLLSSIQQMKDQLSKQFKLKVVEIPTYMLRDEIKKAQSLLNHTNRQIQDSEQHVFRFGG